VRDLAEHRRTRSNSAQTPAFPHDPTQSEIRSGHIAQRNIGSEFRRTWITVVRPNTDYVCRMVMPPSTAMVTPLTKLDAGRQRLSVMWATSSGKP